MLSLILPTYKERESLPILIPRIVGMLEERHFEVIIVDDDSPDRTWEVARELGRQFPQVHVIRRVGRRGLSSAVIEGFLAAKGEVFAVMDADGQHDMFLLPELAREVEKHGGIAMGSRYMEGGSTGGWTGFRAFISRVGGALAIWLCRVKVTDPMSGFFAIDRTTLEEVLPRLNPMGFKILLDLLVHVRANTRVKELPFSFGERLRGESKFSTKVRFQYLEFLYDATVGSFIPLTLVKYCVVGALGVAVNLAAYLILSQILLGTPQADIRAFSLPFLGGMEAAILFNFLLNNSWTFATVKLRGFNAFTGFVTFNFACLFGALANYAVSAQLSAVGMGLLTSVIIGAFVGMVWNYTMSRLLTWKV